MSERARYAAALVAAVCCSSLSACGEDPVADDTNGVPVVVPDAASDAQVSDLGQPTDDTSEPAPDADNDTSSEAPDADDVDAEQPDAAEDATPIPDAVTQECASRADCNDGLDCTTDTCTADGLCEWTLLPETCLIGSQCRAAGAASERNSCAACIPSLSQFGYSLRPDDSSCDDGNECTVFDVCTAGVCGGTVLECGDDNPCTNDTCDPDSGCVFAALPDGDACDDESACTQSDECIRGNCVGRAVVCDDGNACTDDTCDPETGCEAINHERACDGGNACVAGNLCSEGVCGEGEPVDCDDGNPCTIDLCDELAGCTHLPTLSPCCTGAVSICDDGDPCTSDICDPDSLDCAYEFNSAPCDDGNICTSGDQCSEGECIAGGPLLCDDGNDCTDDFCRPGVGCDETPLTATVCEDGDACTGSDQCVAGVCQSGESICSCEPVLGLDAVVLTSIAIGEDGRPGRGLNLDRDLATCSPEGNCEEGIDNALSVLAGFANEPLATALLDGSISILLDFDDIQRNPFNAAVYTADVEVTEPPCVPQEGTCSYTVSRSSFDSSCAPVIGLPGTRAGSNVAAGGDTSIFALAIPFGEGGSLALTLYRVRFQGTVTFDGTRVSGLDGIIAGAVRKSDLLAAIDAIPDESLPIDRSGIVTLLNIVVQNDIDTDGNGTLDAASIGLVVSGVPATIIGVGE